MAEVNGTLQSGIWLRSGRVISFMGYAWGGGLTAITHCSSITATITATALHPRTWICSFCSSTAIRGFLQFLQFLQFGSFSDGLPFPIDLGLQDFTGVFKGFLGVVECSFLYATFPSGFMAPLSGGQSLGREQGK